ncbi:MAG: periplasmic binding protein [Actinomycetia bacterium]|jgi:iron complex transport system substrate-binding protein|nr:periplasmic binding protein [Actinomycetes bacterium]
MLRRTVLLVVLLVAVLAASSSASGGRHATTPLFPLTVKTANGSVTIAKRPTRIVSLSPTATESLFAVGAGAQVIAVDDQSDYPKQAPKTALSGYRPNLEAIASYNPDLVIVSNDGGVVAGLQKLGVTVLVEPAANTVAEAYDEIRQIGQATGNAKPATTVVRGMQSTLTKLIRSVPKKARHLKVFHELSPDYYSATSSTFIGRIYRLFGFTNIADAADTTHSGYPKLSAEYIVAANPDIVVLADSVCCSQTAGAVAGRPGWQQVNAVRRNRVIPVDDSIASRWGPRIVDFARVIAQVAKRS